jgi:hypothetical protein
MRWASGDGVSPSSDGPGDACFGWVRRGGVWCGPVGSVLAMSGRAGCGEVWPLARVATAALGASAPSAALIGGVDKARQDTVMPGAMQLGKTRLGAALADLSTEPYGALCWVH